MKRITLLSVLCLAVFGGANAADMSGDFNTWLGYIAGINADGDRTTVQGAGAGGEATGLIRTDLIGAAAGAYSSNLTDCVGIGYRALRNASDMREVVAIGTGAFTNRTGLTRATYINGQFVAYGQNNTFAVKANRNTPDTNAPIYYADGVLNLNADEIRFNGATASTGGTGGNTSAPSLAGFDLYVDCVNGDDSNTGTTPGTAKRTIDGALLAEGQRIALLAGVHSVPTNPASQHRDFFAPYGKRFTTVKGKTSDLWGFQVKSIRDCTMDDLVGDKNGYPSFCGYATNCIINTRTTGSVNSAILISTIEDCVVKCLWDYTANQGARSMFDESVFRNSTIHVYATNGYFASLCSTYPVTFENCFITGTNIKHFVYTGSATLRDCTVLIPENATMGNLTAYNSLIGYGDGTATPGGTGNICGGYTNIAPRIGADLRPAVTDWQYYFHGYGSERERVFKEAVKSSILAELAPDE